VKCGCRKLNRFARPKFPLRFSEQVIAKARELKMDYKAVVLPCGHYTTGETPYKYMDGWYLGSFVYQAFKALREQGVGAPDAALSVR